MSARENQARWAAGNGREKIRDLNARRVRLRVGGEQLFLGMASSPEEHQFSRDLIQQGKDRAWQDTAER